MYTYNPVTVVLLAEIAKLIASCGIFMSEGNTLSEYITAVMKTSNMFKLYLIPSGLYAIYNVLIFYNLKVGHSRSQSLTVYVYAPLIRLLE
jgi:UDP-sugar transporter A1/2/3